jgi:hypothetical protein
MPGWTGSNCWRKFVYRLDDGGRVPVIAISAFYLRQIQSVCIKQIFWHVYQAIHPREISGKQFLASAGIPQQSDRLLFWQRSMNPLEYDISVRELAEFVHRRGDLGSETFRRPPIRIGSKGADFSRSTGDWLNQGGLQSSQESRAA